MRAPTSHQCGLGSNPGSDAIPYSSLLLVFALAPRCFFLGIPFFPFPQNQNFLISVLSEMVDEESLCRCATSELLFIHFLVLIWKMSYLIQSFSLNK